MPTPVKARMPRPRFSAFLEQSPAENMGLGPSHTSASRLLPSDVTLCDGILTILSYPSPAPRKYREKQHAKMSARAVVRALDHLVITCKDIARTSAWYSTHLGMKHETFTAASDPTITRHALKFGAQKINLHQQGKEFEPKATTALPGTADLCFLVENGTDLEAVLAQFQKDGIEVLEGAKVVGRTGANGPIRSIYVRDPDGNLVE